LDLEIALSGVSANAQPHGLLQPGRRCVETSDDVTNFPLKPFSNECRALFATLFPRNPAAADSRMQPCAPATSQQGSNGLRATEVRGFGLQCFAGFRAFGL
jgi:hypothetical protein